MCQMLLDLSTDHWAVNSSGLELGWLFREKVLNRISCLDIWLLWFRKNIKEPTALICLYTYGRQIISCKSWNHTLTFKTKSFLHLSFSKTFCPLTLKITSTATEAVDGWCENLRGSDSRCLPVIFMSRRKNRKCQTIRKSNYKCVS